MCWCRCAEPFSGFAATKLLGDRKGIQPVKYLAPILPRGSPYGNVCGGPGLSWNCSRKWAGKTRVESIRIHRMVMQTIVCRLR